MKATIAVIALLTHVTKADPFSTVSYVQDWTAPLTSGTESAFATDVNGDGELDVVACGDNGGAAVAWYESSAGGQSFTPHTITNLSPDPTLVHGADVNHDGLVSQSSAVPFPLGFDGAGNADHPTA